VKKRVSLYFAASCVTLLLFACKPSMLDPFEYVQWIEDAGNGLKKSKEIDKIEFIVQFKTTDYILLKENSINPLSEKEKFENEKKELGDLQYFTLKIKTPEGTDPLKFCLSGQDEYFARVKYYSFEIQNDLSLVDGSDTIQCVLSHFERNYGIAPEITCLVGFPPKDKKSPSIEDKSLIYYDRVFNNGNLVFAFSKKDISQTPKLKS